MVDPQQADQIIRCEYGNCSKILTSRELLRKHLDSCHFISKPHECQICFKRFSSKQNKREHVRIEHSYSSDHQSFQKQSNDNLNCEIFIPKLTSLIYQSSDPNIRPFTRIEKIYLFADLFDKVKLPEIGENRQDQRKLPSFEVNN